MEQELITQLTEITELAKNGIIKTSGLAAKYVPELVSQLLLFKTILYGVGLISSIALGFIVYKVVKLFLKLNKEEAYKDWDLGAIFVGIFGGTLSLIWFLISLTYFLKITIAPKLYLLEYIREIL